MPHPGRADAGFGQPIVEPAGRAIAQVGAQRLMDRREDLQQHKNNADKREPRDLTFAVLDGRNEDPHGDREHCGQHAPQHEHDPPHNGQGPVRLRQYGEELPPIAGTQTF